MKVFINIYISEKEHNVTSVLIQHEYMLKYSSIIYWVLLFFFFVDIFACTICSISSVVVCYTNMLFCSGLRLMFSCFAFLISCLLITVLLILLIYLN